ncbi:unnamed protein product, partial [Rotaria magnacalcarata]
MSQQPNPCDNSNMTTSINSINNDRTTSESVPCLLLKNGKNVSNKKILHKTGKVNRESILFIWLDLQSQSTPAFIHSLRAINDRVQIYSDESTCLDALKTSQDKIFLISTSSNQELIAKLNAIESIEAIFVPDSDVTFIKGEYTKLLGFFPDILGLLLILKEKLERFKKIMLETFLFEQDNLFQWLQSWKEELTNQQIPANNRKRFLKMARAYYRSNPTMRSLINEFKQRYHPKDALSWCLLSPFPSCLIRHAFLKCQMEQLNLYRFLIADTSRSIQIHSNSTKDLQLYRGMKLTRQMVDTFAMNTGRIVCASGFLTCIKSRATALDLALSPEYRPDHASVLFKIHCNSSSYFAEIPSDNRELSFVFDLGVNFRIIFINRGKMTVIKMRTVSDEDDKLSQTYKSNHRRATIQTLFDELLASSKPLISLPLKPLSSHSSRPPSSPSSTSLSPLLPETLPHLFLKPHSSKVSTSPISHSPKQSSLPPLTSLSSPSSKSKVHPLSPSLLPSSSMQLPVHALEQLPCPSPAPPLAALQKPCPGPPTKRLFDQSTKTQPHHVSKRRFPSYSKSQPPPTPRRLHPPSLRPTSPPGIKKRFPPSLKPISRSSSAPLFPPHLKIVNLPPPKQSLRPYSTPLFHSSLNQLLFPHAKSLSIVPLNPAFPTTSTTQPTVASKSRPTPTSKSQPLPPTKLEPKATSKRPPLDTSR